jgi:glycerophosphoryl diester phosphodiesterase
MKSLRLLPLLLITFATFSSMAQDTIALPENFDVQGHRGARGLKPENTLPAFETALDLGVTTLELDMHFTSDGVVVIWHDDRIESDKCGLNPESDVEAPNPDSFIFQGDRLLISQLSWEQIQAYRCDRNPDDNRFPEQDNSPTALAGDDYSILSLNEVFAFVAEYAESDLKTEEQRENARRVLFNIETKRKVDNPRAIDDDFDGENVGAFELAILDIIAEYELEERVVIQSFDHRSLWAIRNVDDSITLAALTTRRLPDLADLAAQGADIWSPNYQDLSIELVQEAHDLGLKVIPWTVNDVSTISQLITWGVDGIITDRPDIILGGAD